MVLQRLHCRNFGETDLLQYQGERRTKSQYGPISTFKDYNCIVQFACFISAFEFGKKEGEHGSKTNYGSLRLTDVLT
jgi:hypothetical protein